MEDFYYALASAAVTAGMCGAAFADWRTQRIPNSLTVSLALIALCLRIPLGWGALGEGLLAVGLAFAVSVPLFALGAFGGGDAKLVMAAGAFLGPGDLLVSLLITAVVGGIAALVTMMRRGVWLPVLMNTWELTKYLGTFGRKGERRELPSTGSIAIPYAIPIAVGTLATWFFPLAEWMQL